MKIETLNDLVDNPDPARPSTVEELYGWEEDILPLVDWWRHVNLWVFGLNNGDYGDELEDISQRAEPIRQHSETIATAFSDLMTHLPKALLSAPYFAESFDDSETFARAALRRYRIYTRTVCNAAKRGLPGMDRSDLEHTV
jgi:hypothetical protein